MNESPVLLHVWSVEPEHEGSLVERLRELFGRVSDEPGFVSARILASEDRRSVAALIEMRSVADRQRLEGRPEVRETLGHIRGAYNLVVRLYHQVEAGDQPAVARDRP